MVLEKDCFLMKRGEVAETLWLLWRCLFVTTHNWCQ